MDIQALSQLAGGVTPTAPVLSAPGAADDLVVDRFNKAMEVSGVAGVAPVDGVKAADSANGVQPASLGASILQGLDSVSADVRSAWQSIKSGVPAAGVELRVSDLIAMQGKIVEFSFLYDLVGKGVSKTLQDLDSLVKMQ